MKKILLLGVLLMAIASVSASPGTQPTTMLTAILEGQVGNGMASVRVHYGLNTQSTARVETRGLPYLGRGGMYEAWFVDAETGHMQSAGIFPGKLSASSVLTYTIQDDLSIYDKITITQEPFPDNDPRPGKKVMSGILEPSTRRDFRLTMPTFNYVTTEGSLRYKPYSLGKR